VSAAGSKVSGSPGTPSAPGVTLRMSHGRNGCLMTARSRTFACASKGRARRAVPPTAPRAGATGQSTPCAGVGDHHLVGGRADGVDRRIASRRVVAVDHAEPRVGAVVEAAQHTTRCGTERVGTMSWRTPSGCRCRSWPAPGCRRFGVPAARGRRAAASACHRGCRHRPARRGLRAAPWLDCHVLLSLTRARSSMPSDSAAGRCSASTTRSSRGRRTANRPASSTQLPLTSSSGSVVPTHACESSDVATRAAPERTRRG
jgi:hypothetical protein